MQTLYIVIGRDALFLYEKDQDKYNRLFIEGNSEFRYRTNHVQEDMKGMLKVVMEQYNLECDSDSGHCSEITFTVVENADPFITEAVVKGLGEYLSQTYKLEALLPNIIMCEAEMPLIKEFGINFDGINYRVINGALQKNEYSLLGYTLQEDELIRYVR